ncbi:MAG: N,N-dimethylformamidase beta subunit family domain-containing protein, partial [Solirubrobacteraceae bacterium]
VLPWPASSSRALVALLTVTGFAVVLGLAGCGGGSAGSRRTGEPAPKAAGFGPRGHPGYRWLVRTGGPPPSIAAENRQPGTHAWRLPGPAAEIGGRARGAVTGYVARPSVLPGQVERIYASAPGARRMKITVFRIGWYHGRGGRAVLQTGWLRVAPQPGCRHSFTSGLTRCDWRPTLSFVVPSALASGVYIAKLSTSAAARDCLFVVRARTTTPLLVQVPTATYQAYNAWGGDSLYPGGAFRVGLTGTSQGTAVSYDRPYDSQNGAGQFFARDVAMVRFLERYGYPISYTTSESVDADPAQVRHHRALIDIGHSEYWSVRQERTFARALHSGTSLLFFSSDLLAEPVRYVRTGALGAAATGPTIVAQGGPAAGRGGVARGDRFRRRSARLTGSAYLGCITPRLPGFGPPVYHYYGWSPAPALKPAWLFRGTGIRRGTTIRGIVGYELDARTSASPRGTRVIGGGSAPCMSAGPFSSRDMVPGAGGNTAQSTLYTTRSGAIVFSAGTLGWELGLEPVPSASPDAPRAPEGRLVAITRNLLRHVLRVH